MRENETETETSSVVGNFIKSKIGLLMDQTMTIVSDPVYDGMISSMKQFFFGLEKLLIRVMSMEKSFEKVASQMESL